MCGRPTPLADVNELRAIEMCELLLRHGVSFIVIGGVAGSLIGSELQTSDFDLVPANIEANLDRLALALVEVHARLRLGGPPDVIRDFGSGEWLLGAKTWTFSTDLGDLDVLFEPAGVHGFEDLAERATPIEAAPGLVVQVASLDDLIAMKEAANRAKDQLALPILRWLRDRRPDEPRP